jgi:hypothetical protein
MGLWEIRTQRSPEPQPRHSRLFGKNPFSENGKSKLILWIILQGAITISQDQNSVWPCDGQNILLAGVSAAITSISKSTLTSRKSVLRERTIESKPMNKAKLISSLQQIKSLADESLKELGGKIRSPDRTSRKPPEARETEATLPGHLLALRSGGFFKQPKTAAETHAELKPTYPCDVDRVAMALLRLHKRKQLRKTKKSVGKRKQIAYVS